MAKAMHQRDEIEAPAHDQAHMEKYWELSDDLVKGIEEVREGGEKYLPRFPHELQETYRFRLMQTTVMTNIFADIVESLASKPFERETALVGEDVPSELQRFVEDVDGSGNNLNVFAAQHFYYGIKSGLDWIFIDYPERDPSIRTLADAQEAGLRPFWSRVLARNVREVRSKFIGSKEQLTYVRILEPGKPNHVRIIQRDDAGVVTWQLWRKTEQWNDELKTFYVADRSGSMDIDEIPLVPFFTGRRNGKTWKFDPPLRAAADLQLHLYRQESGLNYATTLTAYPMLSASGVKPERDASGNIKPIPTGPNVVLWAPPTAEGVSGSWKYVEPSSNSLEFLARYIDKIISNLRELGRQPLTATSSNLTSVTTAFAAGKSKSAVKAWALSLKDALENAMRITAKWMNSEYEATVSVYTEFDDFVDGKDYEALISARQNKDISLETFWEEMQRRGLLSVMFTSDREKQRLLAETPGDGVDVAI
jgi:hypothetical protein